MDMELPLNFTKEPLSLSLNPLISQHLLLIITPQSLISFAIFFISLVLFLVISIFAKNKRGPPLPPGPSPWPLVGSLPEMCRNRPVYRWIHRVMEQLNTEIACFRLGNTNVITVTSPAIARELLKKNDANLESRPFTVNTEVVSRGFLGTILTPGGIQWKKMRKVMVHDVLSKSKMQWMFQKRNEEADNLVRYVHSMSSSKFNGGQVVNVRSAAQHYTANVTRKMVFGKRYFGKGREDGGPGVEEEEYVCAIFKAHSYIYAFSVVDYLPWTRVLDVDEHEKSMREAMKVLNKYHDVEVEERVEQWKEGKKREAEDLLDVLITLKDDNGNPVLTDEEIKAQIAEIVIATAPNPSSAAEWALSEMLNQQEQLQKATEELDKVVGRNRIVQEYDIPNLPYVTACVKETLRLHPMSPFNPPRVSAADCVAGGYLIPKGSHVLISRVGLGRNPRVWEDPMRFDPERHLKETVNGHRQVPVSLAEPQLRFMSFSAGRRGCLGSWLGTTLSVMLLARLVQGFTWSIPFGVDAIDLANADSPLLKHTPLLAHAKPRLHPTLYPLKH